MNKCNRNLAYIGTPVKWSLASLFSSRLQKDSTPTKRDPEAMFHVSTQFFNVMFMMNYELAFKRYDLFS